MDYEIPGFDNALKSIVPLVRTTGTVTGTTVDLLGYDAAVILVDAGTVVDGTHTITVTESADDSTYTAVAAGDLEGTFTVLSTTTDDQCYTVGYRGTKRYLRPVVTAAGSSTGGTVGVLVLRGRKKYRP